MAVLAAEDPRRRVPVAVALEAHVRPAEELHVPDRAETAAPSPGPDLVRAQLVAGHAERVVGLDVLDRVVPGVRVEDVDGVDAVFAEPPAVGPSVMSM